MTQTCYCQFSGLGRDMVLYVTAWFLGCRRRWVAIRVFLVVIDLFSAGFLLQQGSSLCRDDVLSFVMTMSRQRVPCRSRDGRGKRSRLRQDPS